jgi:hypothetical protein
VPPRTSDPAPGKAVAGHDAGADSPVFILTMARSGSTLLRFILDAHPSLCCPPELSVAATAAYLAHLWTVAEGVPSPATPTSLAEGQLTDHARAAIREAIQAPLVPYMTERGATRWCDKSLDGVLFARVAAALWPRAQFICLYRHCMDVIASGLEACRWGPDAFGFEEFAPQFPGNNVAAIGACWADMTARIIDFEKEYPERSLRVRYEDLVADAEEVAGRIFEFLSVPAIPGISRSCFAVAHDANGPGDAKIWFTAAVSAESVGRGREVPAHRLPAHVRANVNRALSELGYGEVGEDWDADPDPDPDRSAGPDAAKSAHPPPAVAAGAFVHCRPREARHARAANQGGEDADLAAVTAALAARDSDRRATLLGDIARCWPVLAGRVLSVEVTGPGAGRSEFRWNIPGPGWERAEQTPLAALSAPAAVWRPVLDGTANLFVEVFGRRITSRGIANAHRRRTPEVHALGVLLGVAQFPAVARPAAEG